MNYGELKSAIRAYMENEFPATLVGGLTSDEQMDLMVRQAENRIYNNSHILILRKNVRGSVVDSVPYLTLPNDFLSVYSIAVVGDDGSYEYLMNKDVSYIREAYPQPYSRGKPTTYALFGPATALHDQGVVVPTDVPSLMFGPTPDRDYTLELHYFYYPASITSGDDTMRTWLGDTYPTVLLYGALLEAGVFMQMDEHVMALLTQRYETALEDLKTLSDGRLRQDTYRSGQVRRPVL